MASLTLMIDRWEQLRVSLPQMARSAVVETKESYLSLNATQMAMGLTKEDKPITLDGDPFYHPATKRYKKEFGIGLGRVTDRITLFMTGDMYRSEQLEVSGNDIVLTFNTYYSDSVIERTGDKVLGLSPENKSEYRNGAFAAVFKPMIEAVLKLEFI